MRDLSLHILDIVQNSLRAEASCITIRVSEDPDRDWLTIEVIDNGRGMTPEQLAKALDPFYTTRSTRKVGLGLSLFQANCQAAGGDLTLESQPGKGTRIKAGMVLSHIDRLPLGDLPATLITLIAGAPEVDFCWERRCGAKEYKLATRELRKILGDVPLNQPEVIKWLQDFLQEQENTVSI